MKRQRKLSTQAWRWALYDWANSAFATTVMAGFFPIFFKSYWASDLSDAESTFVIGSANSLVGLVIAVSAPILGAIAEMPVIQKKITSNFCNNWNYFYWLFIFCSREFMEIRNNFLCCWCYWIFRRQYIL